MNDVKVRQCEVERGKQAAKEVVEHMKRMLMAETEWTIIDEGRKWMVTANLISIGEMGSTTVQ